MINKRYLNFKTFAEFDRLNQAGEIRPDSIVWIAETNQMYTHNTFYNCVTEEQAEKINAIQNNGTGLKYLTDRLTYEELPDQATVIDIDGGIMSLTNESSNEDILAVFGTLPDFTSLVQVVRNPDTILNGILVSDDTNAGKIAATILASKETESITVVYFDGTLKMFVSIQVTNIEGTLSCIREEFGSVGGDTTPEIAIVETTPTSGMTEKVIYEIVEGEEEFFIDNDAPADGNIYGRKDNAWEKIESSGQTDLSNYIAKDNTTEFTPTSDYNPATKKYVDDNIKNNINVYSFSEFSEDVNIESDIIDYEKISKYNGCVIVGFTLTTLYEYASAYAIVDKISIESEEVIRLSVYGGGTSGYEVKMLMIINSDGKKAYINDSKIYSISESNENSLRLDISKQVNDAIGILGFDNSSISASFNIYKQRIITESAYAALGDAPLTDGILYFVTPDE